MNTEIIHACSIYNFLIWNSQVFFSGSVFEFLKQNQLKKTLIMDRIKTTSYSMKMNLNSSAY